MANRTAHTTGAHITRFAAEPSLARALPHGMAALVSSLRG